VAVVLVLRPVHLEPIKRGQEVPAVEVRALNVMAGAQVAMVV
jgi:hypothetical protein